jgi:hypothetical protein
MRLRSPSLRCTLVPCATPDSKQACCIRHMAEGSTTLVTGGRDVGSMARSWWKRSRRYGCDERGRGQDSPLHEQPNLGGTLLYTLQHPLRETSIVSCMTSRGPVNGCANVPDAAEACSRYMRCYSSPIHTYLAICSYPKPSHPMVHAERLSHCHYQSSP